jgi:hypothetical protein
MYGTGLTNSGLLNALNLRDVIASVPGTREINHWSHDRRKER